jgi:hypothetical protein
MVSEVGLPAAGLYTVIKSFMDHNTRTCYPSHVVLAGICGCNERTIIRLIKVLEGHGMVKVQRKHKTANVYYISWKNWWGIIDCLPNSVHMRCPEHDLLVITVNKRFLCPKCLMDVGKYCEEVLQTAFPYIGKENIYGKPRENITSDVTRSVEDGYWATELRKLKKYQQHPLIPDYQTKDILFPL